MPYPFDQAKLDKWCAGRANAVAKRPEAWDQYDGQIRVTAIYSAHLGTTPGYIAPDFQKIKTMLWVETGAEDPAWPKAPMQCGVNHDLGLGDLLDKPQGHLVLPPQYRSLLTRANVPANGNLNIAGGVGYLLMRLANFNQVPERILLLDSPQLIPFSPLSGTVPFHNYGRSSQPSSHHLHSNDHPHPKTHLGITGWKALTLEWIARTYNGGGDGNYLGKLQFCYKLVQERATPKTK